MHAAGRPHAPGEEREDLRIDPIRLRELPRGLREVAHLARVSDDHRERRGGERGHTEQLVPTSGLEHDELRRRASEPCDERPDPALIIRHRPSLPARARRHHQFRFRHVDPNQHRPSLRYDVAPPVLVRIRARCLTALGPRNCSASRDERSGRRSG